MPSDPATVPAPLALAGPADAFRSALASTIEQLRGLLAGASRGDAALLEAETAALGAFAQGRIDVARFVAVTSGVRDQPLELAASPVLERAYAVLHELSEAGYGLFRVVVPPDDSLHDAVGAALSRIGRAFGAARVASLVRAGAFNAEQHERMLAAFDHRRWNATERAVAPPLEVEVDGADLQAAGLSEFLDGRQKILLRVRGACPPAPLARLMTRGTYVQQASDPATLQGLAAWHGPGIAALVPEGCARFVHDPRSGGGLAERLHVDFLPEDAGVRPLGAWSTQQQLEDLEQLRELASTAPAPAPATAGTAKGTPADHLAAFLLSRADLAGD